MENNPPTSPTGARDTTTPAGPRRTPRDQAPAQGYETKTWGGMPSYHCTRCTRGYVGEGMEEQLIAYGEVCEINGCPIRAALENQG